MFPVLIRQNAYNPYIESWENYEKKISLRQKLLQFKVNTNIQQKLINGYMLDFNELLFYEKIINTI